MCAEKIKSPCLDSPLFFPFFLSDHKRTCQEGTNKPPPRGAIVSLIEAINSISERRESLAIGGIFRRRDNGDRLRRLNRNHRWDETRCQVDDGHLDTAFVTVLCKSGGFISFSQFIEIEKKTIKRCLRTSCKNSFFSKYMITNIKSDPLTVQFAVKKTQ